MLIKAFHANGEHVKAYNECEELQKDIQSGAIQIDNIEKEYLVHLTDYILANKAIFD